MTIEVHPAELADARGIAEVHVQCWREAYGHLVPARNLARLSVDQRELRWAEIIPSSDGTVWVASEGRAIVGFGWSGPSNEPVPPRDLELRSLYVFAIQYGTGVGQRLLEAVLGDAPASLWVADDNPRARAFYTRNGFRPDGVTKVGPVAGTDILEVRMVR
jgi:GNAT superfamily N-acetyltransferase